MSFKARLRCPCCDSIFEIEIVKIEIERTKVILNKSKSKEER